MKNIVNGYKEAIKQNGREIDAKITYTLNGVSKELGNEILNSLTPHYEGGILKSVMKQLDIDSNEDIPLETQINAQFGLKVNDEYKYINLGDYIVYSSEKQEDTRSYKIIAYDKLLYSMKPYERLRTKNLFDKSSANVGYTTNSNGQLVEEEHNFVSDFIEIENNTDYYITSISPVALGYNANKEFVSYLKNSASSGTFNTGNCKYIRVRGWWVSDTSQMQYYLDNAIVNKGTTGIDYEPYYVQYPITIRNYIKAICYQLGIDFANANDTFVNYDKEIESELYLDDEGYSLDFTYRDVLDQLAQVTASTICINDDNELEVRYINDTQGKNLFNKDSWYNKKAYLFSSNRATIDKDGTITSVLPTAMDFGINVIPPLLATATQTQIDQVNYVGYDVGGIEKITISFNNPNLCIGQVLFIFYKADYGWLSAPQQQFSSSNVALTFTIPNNAKYMCIRFDNESYNTTPTILKIENIQMEVGTSATDFEPYGDTIDEEYLKDINVNFGEKYGPINTITFKRSAGSDMISRSIPEDLSDDLKNEIVIEDNEILNGNDRDEFIDGILNKLYGLEYYLNDYSSTGITYYDLCDRYNVKVDDKFYSCIMFNDDIQITQGLVENIHTDRPEESETDYSKTSRSDRALKQAYIIVDKAEGRIDEFVGQITDLQNLVDSQGNEITELGTRVTTTEQGWQARVSAIDSQLANGVSLVKTTSVLINDEGLHVMTDTSITNTTMTTNAFEIRSGDTKLAFIGYDPNDGTSKAEMDNLTVKRYFVAGYHRTEGLELENARGVTEQRTCVFYIGG